MSDFGFDFKELANYEKKLLEVATVKMPRESRKFIGQEGTKLRKITVSTARAKVKKKTGNYFKSIKKGKPYIYKGNGGYSVRVYNSKKIAPHAHLIEDGHRIVNHEGQEVGYKPGLKVFDSSRREFENQFYGDIENFIDDMLEKGL